jgi:hypothetical protein
MSAGTHGARFFPASIIPALPRMVLDARALKMRQRDRAPARARPSVPIFAFAKERNLWRRVAGHTDGVAFIVSKNCYHARKAAAALLKMATATSDPAVAAGLIEAAAKLKDEAGELPLPLSVKAPDVQQE